MTFSACPPKDSRIQSWAERLAPSKRPLPYAIQRPSKDQAGKVSSRGEVVNRETAPSVVSPVQMSSEPARESNCPAATRPPSRERSMAQYVETGPVAESRWPVRSCHHKEEVCGPPSWYARTPV